MRRNPSAPGANAVTVIMMPLAVDGTPQGPRIANSRGTFAERAGPPYGPAAFRVSTTRQGGTEYADKPAAVTTTFTSGVAGPNIATPSCVIFHWNT